MNGSSVINILRNTLNLMDNRLVNHGDRVTFILYHMLKCKNCYEKEDLDKFLIVGLLHDVGAYATDEIDAMLTFDCHQVWAHSIYGYLYLRYLSPLKRYAEIILYHHLDYNLFGSINCSLSEVSMYLNIADRVDNLLLHEPIFARKNLERGRGKRFSPEGLDLFYEAERTYGLVDKLQDFTYLQEMDEIIGSIEMTENECRDYLKFLVYACDFTNENTVYRTITTNIVAIGIAREFHVTALEEHTLYYASLLYDLGMLSIPSKIINSPRRLTDSEREKVNHHVAVTEETLRGFVPDDILQIAVRHHERLNGTGYPRHLTEKDLSLLEMILQVSDVIAALSCKNGHRDAFNKEEILQILSEEAAKGQLSSEVVNTFSRYQDKILDESHKIRLKSLESYRAIKEQFQAIIIKFDKFN